MTINYVEFLSNIIEHLLLFVNYMLYTLYISTIFLTKMFLQRDRH